MNELSQRILTGIAFIIVMISCILLSHWTSYALFGLIVFLTGREYQNLTTSSRTAIYPFILLIGYALAAYPGSSPELMILAIGATTLLSALLTGSSSEKVMRSVGVLIIPLSFTLLLKLNDVSQESMAILYFFLLVWTNDTMAYVVGRLFGRTSLSPSISPKKTWEGFIGGLIFTALLSLLLWQSHFSGHLWISVIFGISISIASTLGDLFESSLKRKAGVKDSGDILPGHGGILDRFDGVLIAAPVAYIALLTLGQLFLYLGS